jgi:hypothetical protein
MSEQTQHQDDPAERQDGAQTTGPDDYGTMSVEDEPVGTVDPADLAGTARPDDADVGYEPQSSEADSAGA